MTQRHATVQPGRVLRSMREFIDVALKVGAEVVSVPGEETLPVTGPAVVILAQCRDTLPVTGPAVVILANATRATEEEPS